MQTTLEETSEFITDGTHGSPRRTEDPSGIPLLSAKNVFDGEVRWDDFDRVPPSELEEFQKRLRLKKGDVLMTCVGTIGRAAVWLKGQLSFSEASPSFAQNLFCHPNISNTSFAPRISNRSFAEG